MRCYLAQSAPRPTARTLYKKPLYNAVTDFAPVALVAEQPLVLVVRKDLPAGNLKEFAAYAKANAAKLSFGSGGSGSATHLGCLLLNSAIGVEVQHVPYRGSAPALQDLMAGRIDYLCDAVSTELAPIKAGNVKPIAVLARQRSAVLPNVPTAQQEGLPNFDANNWIALFFPRNTPEPIIHRLREATVEAMKDSRTADAYGGDRHRFGVARSHHPSLSQEFCGRRNQKMGGTDQSEWRIGGLSVRTIWLDGWA